MATLPATSALIAAASFEERSAVWTTKFLDAGGKSESVFLANVVESDPRYGQQLSEFVKLGLENIVEVDRFSSRSIWSWSQEVVDEASQIANVLVIDVTCMPRELLGMLLFAVSVRRCHFTKVYVTYVGAPKEGYATQNSALEKSDQWLARGVTGIRSIVGYPGAFRAERPSHLVALAGHEIERLSAIAEYVEPSRLTISGEEFHSSTSSGAAELSTRVAEDLKDRIQIPHMGDITFSASSVIGVYDSLGKLGLDASVENVTLVALNTKLAFVGTALFSLVNRGFRMVYAVPREYNPLYCIGAGREYCVDITAVLNQAST